MGREGLRVGKQGMIAEEVEAAGGVRRHELLQEQPAEQAGEHAHGEKESRPAGHPALAVGRDAAARHDHVHMRMMGERRAPGMQHGGDADAGPEMLGVGGDGDQRLGRDLEQEIVDHGLVLVGDVGNGEAMPQGVQRDALVDLRHLRSGVTGAIELARGHRLGRIAAREQPALWTRRLPPGPQQVE